MTRADTAERTLKSTENLTLLQRLTLYGTGSMPVILFISNITVDDLHYGIFYQHVYITIVKYATWKNMASDILIKFHSRSISLSIVYLVLFYTIMTRADTAARTFLSSQSSYCILWYRAYARDIVYV